MQADPPQLDDFSANKLPPFPDNIIFPKASHVFPQRTGNKPHCLYNSEAPLHPSSDVTTKAHSHMKHVGSFHFSIYHICSQGFGQPRVKTGGHLAKVLHSRTKLKATNVRKLDSELIKGHEGNICQSKYNCLRCYVALQLCGHVVKVSGCGFNFSAG